MCIHCIGDMAVFAMQGFFGTYINSRLLSSL